MKHPPTRRETAGQTRYPTKRPVTNIQLAGKLPLGAAEPAPRYSSPGDHPAWEVDAGTGQDMADFSKWCTLGSLVPVGDQQTGVIESHDDATGVATLAESLPNAYAESESLALVAESFGKEGVAHFIRNKLPTKATAGSGDMGETLGTTNLPT